MKKWPSPASFSSAEKQKARLSELLTSGNHPGTRTPTSFHQSAADRTPLLCQSQAEEAAARAAEQERQRIEAQQKAEQEEAASRAADVEHRRSINAAVITAIMLAADVDPEQAQLLLKAIVLGKIPNVSISY